MTIAIDPHEEIDFVLPQDRELPPDDPNRNVWKLRPLSYLERRRLDNMAHLTAAGTANPVLGDRTDAVLRFGLVGCDPPLKDRHGTEIPFEREPKKLNVLGKNCRPVSRDYLQRIPPRDLQLLADAIERGSTLTDEEGKD